MQKIITIAWSTTWYGLVKLDVSRVIVLISEMNSLLSRLSRSRRLNPGPARAGSSFYLFYSRRVTKHFVPSFMSYSIQLFKDNTIFFICFNYRYSIEVLISQRCKSV